MIEWLIFAAIGKLIILLWMKFPLPKEKENYFSHLVHKLHECQLCSGVWVYCLIALFFGVDIFQSIFGYTQAVPQIIGNLATGAVTSWLVHVFSAGWSATHEVTII